MRERHPRSIRDIAHVYISRPRRRRPDARRIAVVGGDRGCFPGFHVANLAAAFSAMGVAVRVVERSGLLPDAAFFLALPPRVYAANEVPFVSAIDGVDVWYAERSTAPAPPAASPIGRLSVELIHAPPLDRDGGFEGCLDAYSAADVVCVARRVDGALGRRCRAGSGVVRAWALRVAHRSGGEPADTCELPEIDGLADAGQVVRWEPSLADPLPVALRSPHSLLARSYRSCCERLAAAGDDYRGDDERPVWREPASRPKRRASVR